MINKKSVLVFLFFILLNVQTYGQVGSETDYWKWTDFKPAHRAVVKVSTEGGSGTGVVVHVDRSKEVYGGYLGHVLTAYHVVQNQRSIKVSYRDCDQRSKDCVIVSYEEQYDVALIMAWIPKKIQPISVSEKNSNPLDEVEFIGLGGHTDLDGRLRSFKSKVSRASNVNELVSDTFLIPGDSGGPVLNKNNELVGINSGGWQWIKKEYIAEDKITITWPARAGGFGPIRRLIKKIRN